MPYDTQTHPNPDPVTDTDVDAGIAFEQDQRTYAKAAEQIMFDGRTRAEHTTTNRRIAHKAYVKRAAKRAAAKAAAIGRTIDPRTGEPHIGPPRPIMTVVEAHPMEGVTPVTFMAPPTEAEILAGAMVRCQLMGHGELVAMRDDVHVLPALRRAADQVLADDYNDRPDAAAVDIDPVRAIIGAGPAPLPLEDEHRPTTEVLAVTPHDPRDAQHVLATVSAPARRRDPRTGRFVSA